MKAHSLRHTHTHRHRHTHVTTNTEKRYDESHSITVGHTHLQTRARAHTHTDLLTHPCTWRPPRSKKKKAKLLFQRLPHRPTHPHGRARGCLDTHPPTSKKVGSPSKVHINKHHQKQACIRGGGRVTPHRLQGAQPMPSHCPPDGMGRFGNLLQPPVYPPRGPPLRYLPFECVPDQKSAPCANVTCMKLNAAGLHC